jgi:hypothetical protein
MKEKKLRRRFSELIFDGLPYTKMLKNTSKTVMYAKELGNHPEEMKCH